MNRLIHFSTFLQACLFSITLTLLLTTSIWGQEADSSVYQDPFAKHEVSNPPSIPDPLESINRYSFAFNKFYFFKVLKPAGRAWRSVTSSATRESIHQFYRNLKEPVTVVNGILQGEWKDAHTAATRFIVNTTFGGAGFFDPASNHDTFVERTFDQTFAKWGIGHGFYILWPIIGPSSPRGTTGYVLEEAMDPFNWADNWEVPAGSGVLETVNWASREGDDFEDLLQYSVDGYSSVKNIYEQKTLERAQK